MNENHMKTSVTTGEVSLRWAKKADQRAKSSENGPISPNCYLLGLRRRLDYGPRQQKYHENVGNNHLKTLNIRSNGKSRLIWFVATFKINGHSQCRFSDWNGNPETQSDDCMTQGFTVY